MMNENEDEVPVSPEQPEGPELNENSESESQPEPAPSQAPVVSDPAPVNSPMKGPQDLAGKEDPNAAPRDPKEIERESQVCFLQAGGLQFEIELKKNQLNHLNQRLHYLNNEMAEWNAIEAEKKAAAAKNQANQAKENLRKAEEKRLRKGAKASEAESTLQ